jgi:cyclohexyl-isocyanide hydratase
MNDKRPLQVGMLYYPRLTQLDLTGPYEVLARMADTLVHILWKDKTPVKTESGLCIVPTLSLRESPNLDMLVVPGGHGQRDLMEDDEVLSFLRKQAEIACYVVSVCTGSLLLAPAGLLRGYRATCHWLFLPLLEPLGAIPVHERVVIDRNRITAAGVSAGIDCAPSSRRCCVGKKLPRRFNCRSNTIPSRLVTVDLQVWRRRHGVSG